MTPTQLLNLLEKTVVARLPVMIQGSPGLGKTSIVEQATEAAGMDIIVSHPVVSDPTDAKGLPWPVAGENRATFLPFGELAQALEATKPTVWLLDDLGQASPAVQASFMQLILARRVNGHKLPDCITFVACTNRRTDRAGVQGILEPVKSRFTTIVELEANLNDTTKWMINNNVPLEVISFLRFRPALLHGWTARCPQCNKTVVTNASQCTTPKCRGTLSSGPSAEMVNSPSPRTWYHAGQILELGLDKDTETMAINGAVGEAAGAEFTGYVKIFRQMPSIDGILLDPNGSDIPSSIAARYAVATALATKVTVANFPQIAKYAKRISEEAKAGDISALLVNDCFLRDKGIANCRPFLDLMADKNIGGLVLGQLNE